jgi:peptide/nickel transport system ATP-binding protein/peptide/nickel transport system permease protein
VTGPHATGPRRRLRLARDPSAVAAAVFLLVVASIAIAAPLVAPSGPDSGTLRQAFEGSSTDHWLGTDHLGRDELSRLVFGARISLLAGVEAVGIALLVGVPLGLLAGYRSGWFDRVTMRVVEVVLALPALVVAIAAVSATGPGLVPSMFAIGLVFSTVMLRLTRDLVRGARHAEYVDGARAAGAGDRRVVTHHVLPNVLPSLTVHATGLFAAAVLAEASLSFLGLGATPPTPSWGVMLNQARDRVDDAPLLAVWPGLAIFLTVLACNRLGDAGRDVIGRGVSRRDLGINPADVVRFEDAPHTQGVATSPGPAPVLALRRLTVSFPGPHGEQVEVVSDVSLDVAPGETVGLVGESGSGKSTIALAALGLVPAPGRVKASSIQVAGTELVGLTFGAMRRIRGRRIGLVSQEPSAALNPALTIGHQLAEPLRWHERLSRQAARARVMELLDRVGVGADRLDDHPHQFSGGEAQRIAIAMALAARPDVLIADEPTTALDTIAQGQVLDLLLDLRDEYHLAVLLISHDLGVVAGVTDRVAVMYAGQIVECQPAVDLFARPLHPYTAALLAAVPRNRRRDGDLPAIPGALPAPWQWPEGCRFAERCTHAATVCHHGMVHLREGAASVRCRRADELHLSGVQQPIDLETR